MSDVKKIAEKFLDQIEIAPKWADTFQCDFNEMEQLAQAYLELEQKLSVARAALNGIVNYQCSHNEYEEDVIMAIDKISKEALAALGKE